MTPKDSAQCSVFSAQKVNSTEHKGLSTYSFFPASIPFLSPFISRLNRTDQCIPDPCEMELSAEHPALSTYPETS